MHHDPNFRLRHGAEMRRVNLAMFRMVRAAAQRGRWLMEEMIV
jgi:hypothetical protein